MRLLGFSTGAVSLGDFQSALCSFEQRKLHCVELSALRLSEVKPLIEALPNINLDGYKYVSFHAPSSFSMEDERWLVTELMTNIPSHWPIILHPDAVHDFGLWRGFGNRLAIENMDRRKACGRTALELTKVFAELPEARLCFDIGHARQFDPSMTEAFLILKAFARRIVQVHLSEVNSESQHETLSYGAKLAFRQVASLIGVNVPIIVESRVGSDGIEAEIRSVEQALPAPPQHRSHSFSGVPAHTIQTSTVR